MGYICMVTYGPGQADARGCLLGAQSAFFSYVSTVRYSILWLGSWEQKALGWVLLKQKLDVTLFKGWVFLSLWHFQVRMRLICLS